MSITNLNSVISAIGVDVGTLYKKDTFVFQQQTAATTWTIQHNMGKIPSVTIYDSSFSEIEGDIVYTDINNITINFSVLVAGSVFLN